MLCPTSHNFSDVTEDTYVAKTSDYGFLKGKGIDTAMEVFVESVGFEGGKGVSGR